MLCLIALTPSPAARMAEEANSFDHHGSRSAQLAPGLVAKPRSKLADCPPTDRECVWRLVRSVISSSSVSLFALVIITAPRGGDRS